MRGISIVLALAALGLAGCAAGSVADPANVGPYPQNYREIVKAHIKATFFDPSSIQDAWIAPPFQGRLLFTDGWVVCVRANAKNRMGAYTGRQEMGYLINSGQIVQEADQADCPHQQYAEWPEIEQAGWGH